METENKIWGLISIYDSAARSLIIKDAQGIWEWADQWSIIEPPVLPFWISTEWWRINARSKSFGRVVLKALKYAEQQYNKNITFYRQFFIMKI